MNMQVAVEDLKFVAEISEEFGLPTPKDETVDELFGPYHLTKSYGFLKFGAENRVWSHIDHNTQMDFEREIGDVIALLNTARPAPLVDETRSVTEPPFIHMGWKFTWMFIPELKRWELAPLGRA